MCLAIPAQVIQIENDMATCRVGDSDTTIKTSMMLLDEEAQLGDYLIVHAGFALRKLDVEEAKETLRLLREMVSLVDGQQAQF